MPWHKANWMAKHGLESFGYRKFELFAWRTLDDAHGKQKVLDDSHYPNVVVVWASRHSGRQFVRSVYLHLVLSSGICCVNAARFTQKHLSSLKTSPADRA